MSGITLYIYTYITKVPSDSGFYEDSTPKMHCSGNAKSWSETVIEHLVRRQGKAPE